MSTSVIEADGRSRRRFLKTAAVYGGVSAFCVIFDNVYAVFGHGVRSAAMSLMFLYPLLGGSVLFLLCALFIPEFIGGAKSFRFAFNCYNSGIAALTVASALKGVFDIAGTFSQYTAVFAAAGALMSAAGAGVLIFDKFLILKIKK